MINAILVWQLTGVLRAQGDVMHIQYLGHHR